MKRSDVLVFVMWATAMDYAAFAQQISVKHVQLPMHRLIVARSESGKVIASGEFSQVAKVNEVTMRMIYRFVDGSIDDEATTYTQQGKFNLVRNQHVQKGPFFAKQVDFTVEIATAIMTTRTADKDGKIRVENKHIDLPDDLANGIVGTLLLNVPHDTKPFRVGMLVPVAGGRVIRLLISPENKHKVDLAGETFKATVFRIHPELGGIVGMIARLIGLQPKDVRVWILEGEEPAVVLLVGQLGGYGPVISSDLVGTSFEK